jgi:DNA-directed RNA polymerase specialized sigma24 family protein
MRYAWQVIPFPATHRSVLERIRSDDEAERRIAFGDLAEGYWRPSYHYLRVHWRLTPEAAEDAVQAFFTTAFEKGYVERFDPAKARFRTFLRVCLDRFVQNQLKAAGRLKRGAGLQPLPLDFETAEGELVRHEPAVDGEFDQFFRREVTRAIFARAVEEIRRESERTGRSLQFRLFERYDLGGEDGLTYGQLAAEFDLPVTQVTNHLAAVRRRFRTAVLTALRDISASDEEYREEAKEILGIEAGD